MRRILFLLTALLVSAPLLLARDEPKNQDKTGTPQEQLKSIDQEWQKARPGIKTQAEFVKLSERLAAQCLEIAEKNSKDPAAFDALLWLIEHGGLPNNATGDKTVELLIRDHLENPRCDRICRAMEGDDHRMAE